MFIPETNRKLQFHCGLEKKNMGYLSVLIKKKKIHAFLIYVIHFYVVLIK